MSEMPHAGKTVGSANGWQFGVFRLNLIIIPIMLTSLVGLSVWLVTATFETRSELALVKHKVDTFAGAGPRYTSRDAKADGLELRAEILDEVEKRYPPIWLRDAVELLRQQITELRQRVDKLERGP